MHEHHASCSDEKLCRSAQLVAARTFLLFLMVTREMPGTGFMPSFCMALRLFFSDRLCLLLEGVPSSASASGAPSDATDARGGDCPAVY
jgi:hypothetical protein